MPNCRLCRMCSRIALQCERPANRTRHSLVFPDCHRWGMQKFIDSDLLDRLRVGPLASYLDIYLKQIEQQGFLSSSVPMQLYAITRFSRWLERSQIDLREVDEAMVERFLRRDPGVVHSAEPASLRRLLTLLRDVGVTPTRSLESRSSQQRLIDEYPYTLLI